MRIEIVRDQPRPTAPARRGLGREPGRFVGRDAELEQLEALWRGGEQLVTLWGSAGVGKTRLATELAWRWHQRGRGAAVFCDLTEARDPQGACASVAAVLDVPLTSSAAVERVGLAVAEMGPALVVLDNFEQLAERAAELLPAWLAAAPEAHWVVTSRERLRLRAEVAFELEPLAVDARDAGAQSAAELMLLDRIHRVRRGYAPDAAEHHALRELVAQLEGLPLAIELIAPRVATLGPHAVLARLRGAQGAALIDGARDAPSAQRSLRASLEASWRLLGAAERAALAQCSVFAGGFLAGDARGVLALGAGDEPVETADDVVASLRDKSLLRAMPDPAPRPAVAAADNDTGGEERRGGTRLGMFAAVQQYAAWQLAQSGQELATVDRHARHYVARAEEWMRGATGAQSELARARLAAERENLFAVADRALRGQVALALGLRAVMAMRSVVAGRGPLGAFLARLDPLCDAAVAAEGAVDAALLVQARATRAALWHGTQPAARARDELDAIARALDAVSDPSARGAVLYNCGRAWLALRRFDRVEQLGEALCALGAATGQGVHEGRGAVLLGSVRREQGAASAAELLERAVARLRAAGAEVSAQTALISLGCALADRGEPARARAVYEDAIAWHRAIGDRINEGFALFGLALLEHDGRRFDLAAAQYAAAAGNARATGDAALEGEVRAFAALARAECGAWREAREALAARYRAAPAGVARRDALFHACLGALDHVAGARAEAREQFARAASVFAQGADPWAPIADELRALVGAAAPGAHAAPDVAELRVARRAIRAAMEHAGLAPPPAVAAPARAAAAAAVTSVSAPAASDDAGALLVHAAGDWFQCPGGPRVRLRARPVLRAVLGALAAARKSQPGEPLSQDALVARAWPAQRIYADAARNRLHGAVHRLRAAGLRDALIAVDDGYLLDPRVAIELVDEA